MNYLTIDVGTTRCKCQLFNEDGSILEYFGKDYDVKNTDKGIVVDADAIWTNVKDMIKTVAEKHEISSFDRKSTRLNSSHLRASRMPSSA